MMQSGRRGYEDERDADFIHDLMNLLARISHSSELGLIIDNMSREDMLRLLSQVHSAARTAIDLVGGYQSCADIDESFDLRDIISRTAEAVNDGIACRVSANVPDLPILTYGNPELLMRVLLNLADNACNAAGDMGHVTLSLNLAPEDLKGIKLMVGHKPTPPFAILTVTDTGPGITDAMLNQIWERGFSTKGRSGSGRGLALVRNVVESVGAGLSVDTCLGSWTKFHVFWPLRSLPSEISGC